MADLRFLRLKQTLNSFIWDRDEIISGTVFDGSVLLGMVNKNRSMRLSPGRVGEADASPPLSVRSGASPRCGGAVQQPRRGPSAGALERAPALPSGVPGLRRPLRGVGALLRTLGAKVSVDLAVRDQSLAHVPDRWDSVPRSPEALTLGFRAFSRIGSGPRQVAVHQDSEAPARRELPTAWPPQAAPDRAGYTRP
jgi:hypothetical protein